VAAAQPTLDDTLDPDDEDYEPPQHLHVDLKGQRIPYDARIEDIPLTGRWL